MPQCSLNNKFALFIILVDCKVPVTSTVIIFWRSFSTFFRLPHEITTSHDFTRWGQSITVYNIESSSVSYLLYQNKPAAPLLSHAWWGRVDVQCVTMDATGIRGVSLIFHGESFYRDMTSVIGMFCGSLLHFCITNSIHRRRLWPQGGEGTGRPSIGFMMCIGWVGSRSAASGYYYCRAVATGNMRINICLGNSYKGRF